MVDRLINEDGYDHHFVMAVRDWGRSDVRAAWAAERSDGSRMATLRVFFEALGYPKDQALIRARVFYFHQIGYYAIGLKVTLAKWCRSARLFIDILCGLDVMDAARSAGAMVL